jgi:cation diffusion facilitator family transporter
MGTTVSARIPGPNRGQTVHPRAMKSTDNTSGIRACRRAIHISLAAGIVQMAVKVTAVFITGSVAIFADAAESAVHLIAVAFAATSLRIAHKPPDRDHPYGHAKVGFFSAGVEGAVILVAAVFILGDSLRRIWEGPVIDRIGWGIGLTAFTVLMNGVLGMWLLATGRRHHQIIVTANGWHVLTDAFTSLGVILGLSLAWTTGWAFWDPVCAILVAVNILVTGAGLVRSGIQGLMDRADDADQASAEALLERELHGTGVSYHALRMRNLGDAVSIDLHLLFDDRLSIREAHAFATALEKKLSAAFTPPAVVMTHLEPRRDHARLHGPAGSG